MEEFKDQLPKEEYTKLKEGITNIKKKIEGLDKENDTIDAIKPMIDEFQKSSLSLFEMAYKKVNICKFIKVKCFCFYINQFINFVDAQCS